MRSALYIVCQLKEAFPVPVPVIKTRFTIKVPLVGLIVEFIEMLLLFAVRLNCPVMSRSSIVTLKPVKQCGKRK